MTSDPYPDPSGAAPPDVPSTEPPVELSAADSRVLDELSRSQPPVVKAVEDDPRSVRAAFDERVAPSSPPAGRGSAAPVFREPTG